MKTSFYLLLIIVTCNAAFTSCTKYTYKPTPPQPDSLKAMLPIRIIILSSSDSAGTTITKSKEIGVKYDTANRNIQLYLDDTANYNYNPYDVLAETYTYNSDDYLISVNEADDNSNDDQNSDKLYHVTINRGADNNINYIAEVSKDGSWYDSIFYKYEPSIAGTVITTVDHYSKGSPALTGENTSVYTYNSNHELTQLAEPDFKSNTLFTLNLDGTVQSYVTTTPLYNATAFYTYSSGMLEGNTDAFSQTLLGKDYYLADLKGLEAFIYPYDNVNDYNKFAYSFTDSHYISTASLQVNGTNGNNFSKSISDTWTYTTDGQNNVVQVVFNSDDGVNETIKFLNEEIP